MLNRKRNTLTHKLTLKIHKKQNTHHKITPKNTYTLNTYKNIYIQKYTQKHVTRAAGMANYELEPGDNPSESDAYDMQPRT